MNASTKKLTTAAVCTALAVIMCVLTAYLPLSFMPLFLAAFCIFLACKRGSLVYGLLSAAAAIGLMFLMTGLSVKWLAFVLMFAPYGIAAYFMHRFTYFRVRHALIRGAAAVGFFNLTFGITFLIVAKVATIGLDGLNVLDWADMVGGYPVLALIATLVLVPLDVVFSSMSVIVLKRIRALASPRNIGAPPSSRTHDHAEQKYDIFGYEIHDGENYSGDNPESGGEQDKT